MQCIVINNPGPDSRLELTERPKPSYAEHEVLVRVHATAVNRADLLQRAGKYPPPEGQSDIPGLEVAGDIVAKGSNVDQFNLGDRVYGLVAGGGYAQYCTVHQSLTHSIPEDWSYEYAAAIPEALVTAHTTAFELGKLSDKQTLLIHGAGSGIASTAIQMAQTINAHIITTVGAESKKAKAQTIGATQVINYKAANWTDELKDTPIDVIVDFIGGKYFNQHLKLLTTQGRLIQIACMEGPSFEGNLLPIIKKRLCINGFVLRSQSIEEKALLWKKAHERWFKSYVNKTIQPIIDATYPLHAIEKAHQHMRSSKHFGKIVITN